MTRNCKWCGSIILSILLCVLCHFSTGSTHPVTHESHVLIEVKGAKENMLWNALQNTQKQHSLDSKHPLIIGFGACLDAIVDYSDFISSVEIDTSSLSQEAHSFIDNANQLIELFLFYFARGSSAERYVTSTELFTSLVNAAHKRTSTIWSLGGNAALMANRLAHRGVLHVHLVTTASARLASFLHSNITLIKPAHIEADDVHYIVEYKKNDRIGNIVAPRANRLALHRDVNNMNLVSIDATEHYSHLTPAAIIIGGLQLMQFAVLDAVASRATLQKISTMYHKYSATAESVLPLHFELASISSVPFMQSIMDVVVKGTVTSIGCNEQEIGMLHDFIMQPESISIEQDPYPSPCVILDKMRVVFASLNANGTHLQRIHVHTVAFQVIMTPAEIAGRVPLVGGGFWDSEAGVKAASRAATEWVCGTKSEGRVHVPIDETTVLLDYVFIDSLNDDMSTMIALDEDNPVLCWIDKYNMHICIAAQLVCKTPLLTIGAGDNISAAALVPVE